MTALDDHAAWRDQRRAAVTGPTGNLALIETRWTGSRPDIAAERACAAETVQITELSRTNMETGKAEHGLRVWNATSPAIAAFSQIDTYDYDPEWVVSAQFTPVARDRTVPFEHIRDNGGTRNLIVPGDITVTLKGHTHTLAAFDDGGRLLLVFADATNASETYGSGRFLFVERSEHDSAQPGHNENVVLDFNRAFVPPCGFSAQYNCPLPPLSNRFAFPVRAGEKNVIFRDGFDIYTA